MSLSPTRSSRWPRPRHPNLHSIGCRSMSRLRLCCGDSSRWRRTVRNCGRSSPLTCSTGDSTPRRLDLRQPRNTPGGGFAHHGIGVLGGHSHQVGAIGGVAEVTERQRRVPHKAAAFGALDRRTTERLAKLFFIHADQHVQIEARAETWFEFGPTVWAVPSRGVVGADLLANVAAKDPFAKARAQRRVNRSAVFDRQVRDATLGGEVIRLVEGVCRAGFDAQPTIAAVLLDGLIKVEFNIR